MVYLDEQNLISYSLYNTSLVICYRYAWDKFLKFASYEQFTDVSLTHLLFSFTIHILLGYKGLPHARKNVEFHNDP